MPATIIPVPSRPKQLSAATGPQPIPTMDLQSPLAGTPCCCHAPQPPVVRPAASPEPRLLEFIHYTTPRDRYRIVAPQPNPYKVGAAVQMEFCHPTIGCLERSPQTGTWVFVTTTTGASLTAPELDQIAIFMATLPPPAVPEACSLEPDV